MQAGKQELIFFSPRLVVKVIVRSTLRSFMRLCCTIGVHSKTSLVHPAPAACWLLLSRTIPSQCGPEILSAKYAKPIWESGSRHSFDLGISTAALYRRIFGLDHAHLAGMLHVFSLDGRRWQRARPIYLDSFPPEFLEGHVFQSPSFSSENSADRISL